MGTPVYDRAYHAQRRARWRAVGACTLCGVPISAYTRCLACRRKAARAREKWSAAHRDKRRAMFNRWRAKDIQKRIAQRQCLGCKAPVTRYLRCVLCRLKEAARQARVRIREKRWDYQQKKATAA